MDITALLAALGVSPALAPMLALSIVGVASALAAALPQPAPGSPWTVLRTLLDVLAMNIVNAKNRVPAPKPDPNARPVGSSQV